MLIAKQILGITVFVFSAFGLMALISGAENYTSAGTLSGMGVLLLGLAFGTWLMRIVRKQKIVRRINTLEEKFPEMLKNSPVETTPARLARENRIPRKAAKEFLERKAIELPAEVKTDEKGRKIYTFRNSSRDRTQEP